MRKINYLLFILTVFVFTNESSAQLFVKGGSYVYNKGSFMYVTGEVELETNSNLYLRQEGQLLQGTTAAGTNKGSGSLSVFQEGTSHAWVYNYWCSPVGNTTSSSVNNDFGITQLGVPTNTPTPTIGFTPASMVTSSYNGTSGAGTLGIASFWIYKYSTPSTAYLAGWQSVGSASTIAAGQGFSMKGVNGDDATTVGETDANNPNSGANQDNQRYDFRGKPNDGNITISVGRDLFTLTGNPYPSAIDLSRFLSENTTLDGVAYFWRQDKTILSHNITSYAGGYEMYNGISGLYTAAPMNRYTLNGDPITPITPPPPAYYRKFSPVGQGFMVKGSATAATTAPWSAATMRNDYRTFTKEGDGFLSDSQTHFERNSQASTSIDYGFYDNIPNVAGIDYTQISKAPNPHIRINSVLNGNAVRELLIGFMNTATDGIERADTASINIAENTLPYDTYMLLDNKEFIHSVTTFDINKRFPIGFKNNGQATASFKVQVYEFVNFDAAENVYLYDGLTGLYHDIKNSFYEVVLAPGVYNNRFEVTFTNQALSTETNIADNFVIVQNNPNQLLGIANPNLLDVKSVTLYDIGGKMIFNKLNLGSEASYEFSTASLSEGVYIVKLLTSDDKSLGQKIVVKRKD